MACLDFAILQNGHDLDNFLIILLLYCHEHHPDVCFSRRDTEKQKQT